MEVLSVGEPIPDRWRVLFPHEGGGVLTFNKEEFILSIGFPNLSDIEISAGQAGAIKMGLLPYKDVLFMIFDIDSAIMVDTSFDPSKVHPDDRGVPNRKDTEGYAVTTLLFDTAKDRTSALRMASITPAFSSLIQGMIEDLYIRLEKSPTMNGSASVKEAYEKYEDPQAMMNACVAVEVLGIPFPTADKTSDNPSHNTI